MVVCDGLQLKSLLLGMMRRKYFIEHDDGAIAVS